MRFSFSIDVSFSIAFLLVHLQPYFAQSISCNEGMANECSNTLSKKSQSVHPYTNLKKFNVLMELQSYHICKQVCTYALTLDKTNDMIL